MTDSIQTVLKAALRTHFGIFAHKSFQTVAPGACFERNWHLDAMACHLEQCRLGNIKRLMISLPPRSGKSIYSSVALPAFILGRDPTRQVINVSYSSDLAADLTRQFRMVINSDWYRGLFPHVQVFKDTDSEFVTGQGGFRYATSVGGTLTGRGCDIAILDDVIKPEEAASESTRSACIYWFQRTLLTRLNDKQNGVIIVIMQRLHENDLIGHILETDPHGWVHLDLPAIAQEPQRIQIGDNAFHDRQVGDVLHPAREPLWVLEQQKLLMGSAAFSAQYLQRPVPATGDIVKKDWFKRYDRVPSIEPSDQVVLSLDTANKAGPRNDPSVCTTWLIKEKQYYLLDVTRTWLAFPDLRRFAIEHYLARRASAVLVEDAGSGTALIQELQRYGGINVIPCKPKGDKRDRLIGKTATIKSGRVHLPVEAPWLGVFEHEVLGFPNVRYDDQVDSLTQFLIWADEKTHVTFSYDMGEDHEIGAPSVDAVLAMPRSFFLSTSW